MAVTKRWEKEVKVAFFDIFDPCLRDKIEIFGQYLLLLQTSIQNFRPTSFSDDEDRLSFGEEKYNRSICSP